MIYLFQSGAPSQHELWDYKPRLAEMVGEDLPPSVRGNQRVTTMTAAQERFPLVPSRFPFRQHGESQTWVSDLMPHTAGIVDELCFIKSMHTEAINHDPGITFFQTGAQLAGRPSIGAWLSYGLGTMNADLPTFVAMISKGSAQTGQPLYDRLWGSGFLPTRYQGVKFLSTGDPVLYLSNPPGVDTGTRRRFLDDLGALNRLKEEEFGDPETSTRIAQYEMAYRMQSSVPELTDLSDEPDSVFELYGPDARQPGTFARNCLLARRLAERGVRFIQCFHRGWDQHTRLPRGIERQARDVDQAQGRSRAGPEEPGSAGRDAGGLGRRVRPQRVLPGRVHRGDLRPGPPSALLHHLDGGRRRQAGHDLRGERRLLVQHRQGPGAHPRPARDDAAPAGHRSHAADLPVSGPRLPSDRCPREESSTAFWREPDGRSVVPAGRLPADLPFRVRLAGEPLRRP